MRTLSSFSSLSNLKPIAATTVVAVALCLVFAGALQGLLSLWLGQGNQRYTHGLLVAVIALVIAVGRYRARQERLDFTVHYWALSALFFCCLLLALAESIYVLMLQQLLLPLAVYLILAGVLGRNAWRLFALPLFLLCLAMPFWEHFNTPLRMLITPLVTCMLKLLSIDAIMDGFYIHVPAGVFVVDASCNGLSAIIIMVTASVLFVQLLQCSTRERWLIVLFAAVLGFSLNVVRIVIVVLAGQLSNMQHYLVVHEHDSLGAALFFVGFTLYIWLISRYYTFKKPLFHADDIKLLPILAPAFGLSHFGLLLLAIVSGPLLLRTGLAVQTPPVSQVIVWPKELAQWQRQGDAELSRDGENYSTVVRYHTATQKLRLTVEHFARQQQGKEAITDTHLRLSGQAAKVLSNQLTQIMLDNERLPVQRILLKGHDGHHELWLRCFIANGRILANPLEAKWYNLVGLLQGRPAITRLTISIDAGELVAPGPDVLRRDTAQLISRVRDLLQGVETIPE